MFNDLHNLQQRDDVSLGGSRAHSIPAVSHRGQQAPWCMMVHKCLNWFQPGGNQRHARVCHTRRTAVRITLDFRWIQFNFHHVYYKQDCAMVRKHGAWAPSEGKRAQESCDMEACAWSFMGPNALPRLLLTFKPVMLADATVAPAHQCCGVSIQASLKNAIFVDSFKHALRSPLQALAPLCTFLLTQRSRHHCSCWADALLGSVRSVTPRPLSFTLHSLQYNQTQ